MTASRKSTRLRGISPNIAKPGPLDDAKPLTDNLMDNPQGKLPNTISDGTSKGKIINGLINRGVAFTPDLAFEHLVKDYEMAEKLYGKTLLKQLTGYDSRYLKKNLRLPEFRRELKQVMKEHYDELKKDQVIDSEGQPTEKGIKLASLALYMDELDQLMLKGLGEKAYKKPDPHGEHKGIREYRAHEPYRNLSVAESISIAVRRGHTSLDVADLRSIERHSKGRISLVYAFDTSGSMKGDKIEMAKKAGIALIYKALSNKDRVGLILFKSDITESIAPTDDFTFLLEKIARVRAFKETNITKAIRESMLLFPSKKVTKHLILLTDALPTVGKEPRKEALEAAAVAANQGITISLVGINLNKEGPGFAKKIVELGKGRLYEVKDLGELDAVVLRDYSELQA